MRSNILPALLLIVLLPLLALGWFAFRLLASEQQALEHQVQSLAIQQLRAVDGQLRDYFAEQKNSLLTAAAELSWRTDALREFSHRQPRVRQVFVMDATGQRLHPPAQGPLSTSEQQFLQRTEAIWRDHDILYQGGERAFGAVAEPSKNSSKLLSNTATATLSPADRKSGDYGWYVWHWGSETDLIFWLRDNTNNLLGFELEPMRVLADLIDRLPATQPDNDNLTELRIQLIDNRGTIAYQWGRFEPETNQVPLAVLPLSHPLGSWKLVYHGPPLAIAQGSIRLFIMLAGLILAIALVSLAIYLYREHTRTQRLASQRVNFVNQVSHELKTPLTNIRMYAEMLEDRLADEVDTPKRYLNVIVNESQRLSRLISNVLNFAGWQKDRLQFNPRKACLDDVVAEALALFQPVLEEKNIHLNFQGQAKVEVFLDSDCVEQIINNLLSNVEKYATSGGQVEISTWQESGFSMIRVRDFGPGIPKRERERIFQPFYRLSAKLSDGVSGTGIGLAISRELARLHGGDIKLVASEQGACFEVSLRTDKGVLSES